MRRLLCLLAAVMPAFAAPELTVIRTEPSAHLAEPGVHLAPYLQAVGRDRAAILCETLVDSTLQFQLSGPGGEATVTSGPVRLHEVEATGLEPASAYTYTVRRGETVLGEGSFHTWPATDDEIRFLIYGDTRTRPDEHHKIASAMAEALRPEHRFVLHSGDLVADGRVWEQWKTQFFDPGNVLFSKVTVLPCPGNHERGSELFREYFRLPDPEWYWALDVGPLHLVALDLYRELSPDNENWRETPQGAWLVDNLASERPWKLLMLHTPIWSLGPHGRARDDGLPREDPMRFARVNLMPLLIEAGYRLVVSGHDHVYERSLVDGITLITSGGGGAPTYDRGPDEQNPHSQVFSSVTHYCDVTVTAEQIRIVAIDGDGNTIDHVTLTR